MVLKMSKDLNNMLVILCFALLPFGLASINTTALPSEEVEALRVIGRKLGKYWDFKEDPCIWAPLGKSNTTYDDNVTCNYEPNSTTIRHVVSISLKGQSLQGFLPQEFANLPYLQNLDLTRNCLNGTIPQKWGSMQRILNISLLANRLTGSIPKELGNISTLTSLTVEDNMMTGIIPHELGNLTRIERLFLNSNYFTGELPASFSKLIAMKEFRIGGNSFSGKIPGFIGGWKNLTSLRIQASGLEGPIPSNITLLETLTDLRISDLRGPDTPFPPFSNATPFKNLILRSCNLIGTLPESLAPGKLKLLDFSFNKLNGSIPATFSALQKTDYIYLTGNLLSGSVPGWMLTLGKKIDLSYNNFTLQSSREIDCQMREINMFAAFSKDIISKGVECLGNRVCPSNYSSLYINCGGPRLMVGDKEYYGDSDSGLPPRFYLSEGRWVSSATGHFLDDDKRDNSIVQNTARLLINNNTELYTRARASALSLTYYAMCMHNGSYNVSLHFAEIIFTNDGTYSSLGRRIFDIYIQGVRVEKDFDISEKARGAGKAIVRTYTVDVITTLEIRLYWAGNGTTNIPNRGIYGPLISAISVDPNGWVPPSVSLRGNDNGVSRGAVAGIVVGAVCLIILILGLLWWWGYLRHKDANELDLSGIELNTGTFTLRQIKTATNNFDVANKIGEGGFGSVYKGVLPDGTLIAVKQLSSKSKQGNREFLNELGMISALQHPHLVKLHGCCIEGNQLLLAYEYMEKIDFYWSYSLLFKANSLNISGNLMELVDPRLDSKYDVQEMMVVINLALACTTLSPTDRPTMSSVVSMLEGRIVPQAVVADQRGSTSQMDHEKLMKQLENIDESQAEEMSVPYTDSSTSAVDLYPVDRFSEYLQKRDDAKKLLP